MLRRSLLGLLGTAPLAPLAARLAPASTLETGRLTGSMTWSGALTDDRLIARSITTHHIPAGSIIDPARLHPSVFSTSVFPESVSAQDQLLGALSLGA